LDLMGGGISEVLQSKLACKAKFQIYRVIRSRERNEDNEAKPPPVIQNRLSDFA